MVEHARQALKLHPAPPNVRTMVDLLHVHGALQVTIQAVYRRELAVAEIAFVEPVRVAGVFSGPGFVVPFEEVVRDDAVAVTLPQGAEDGFAVDAGSVRAGAGLEVVRDAAGGGEGSLAEGAGDIGASMGAGVEVLADEAGQLKIIASFEVYTRTGEGREAPYHAEIVLGIKPPLARLAKVLPMAESVHVLLDGFHADKGS